MKKIFVSTFFLLFLFSMSAYAHSNLITSSPANGQVIEGDLSVLSLQYDMPIQNSSTLTLVNESGQQIPVSVSVNNNMLVATTASSLANGTYQVNWNIISEDGHPISGNYLFLVNKVENAEGTVETSQTPVSSDGGSNNWIIIIIGVVALLVILFQFVKPRGRRRRY